MFAVAAAALPYEIAAVLVLPSSTSLLFSPRTCLLYVVVVAAAAAGACLLLLLLPLPLSLLLMLLLLLYRTAVSIQFNSIQFNSIRFNSFSFHGIRHSSLYKINK